MILKKKVLYRATIIMLFKITKYTLAFNIININSVDVYLASNTIDAH